MLLALYATLVVNNLKNNASKKKIETDISCLTQVYIDFHRQKNTLNTTEVQKELIELLKKLFVLQTEPKAPKNFDLSVAVAQIKNVIQLNDEDLEHFKKSENTPTLFNALTDAAAEIPKIEYKKEKYVYAILMFGFDGFELYLKELFSLPMKEIREIKTLFKKYETVPYSNNKILKTVIALIATFEQVFEAKKNLFKITIPFNETNIMLTADAASSLVLSYYQDIPISTTLLLLETLPSKVAKPGQSINQVLLAAGFHLRDDVTIEIVKKFPEANPFIEENNYCAFTLTTTPEDRKKLLHAIKQHPSKNQNNNASSISSMLTDKASKHLIGQLMITAIETEDYALLAELTQRKQEWHKFVFKIDESLKINQKATIEIIDPNDPSKRVTVPNRADEVLTVLIYAVLKNDPRAVEILTRNLKKFNYDDIALAISRALIEEHVECLAVLLNVPIPEKEIRQQRKNENNKDRLPILLAVTHQIDAKLFRLLLEKFTADNIFLGNPYQMMECNTETGQQQLLALMEFDPWLKASVIEENFERIHYVLDACKKLVQANIAHIPSIKQFLQKIPTNLAFPSNDDDLRFANNIGAFFAFILILNPTVIDSYVRATIAYPATQSSVPIEEINEALEKKKKVPFSLAIKPASQQQLAETTDALLEIIKQLLKIPTKSLNLNTGAITCHDQQKAYEFDCFSFALMIGDFDIVRTIVEKGAEISESHFCFAAYLGHADILQFIIDKNHDYYFSESADKRTPLEYAVLNDHKECVEVLVNSLLNDKTYADTKNATISRYIRKAHQFCTAEQSEIREFLESKLNEVELDKLKQKEAQRIEFSAETIEDPNDNNVVEVDKITARDHRVKFINPELQKNAVAFIEKDHWDAVHKNPKQTDFEDTIKFFSQNNGRFGQRLFSVKKQFDNKKETVLKFRGHGDERLFFKPMTTDEVKAKYPNEQIENDTVYYQSILQKKHQGKFS